MDRQQIDDLLERLHSGQASDEEKGRIEELLSAGIISIEDVETLSDVQDRVARLEFPDAPKSLDRRFYAMLATEREKYTRQSWGDFFAWPAFAPKFSAAALTLIVGMAAGYFLRSSMPASGQQIEHLTHQVGELQEMMMLSLLEKGSATERLKAVGLTREMNEASKKVTSALIRTLNTDENINVRLAALEALKPYATDSAVREALIRSISKQESPLVQISLAELMVALQEKAAVKEFETLMESEKTPPEIKKKIQESIEVLI